MVVKEKVEVNEDEPKEALPQNKDTSIIEEEIEIEELAVDGVCGVY